MNNWEQKLEELYLKNKDIIRKELYSGQSYRYYSSIIDKRFCTDDYVICPICGYLKTNISQHMKNKHGMNRFSYYEKYDYPMVAKNFQQKAANNHIFSAKERSDLSKRMKKKNPMKDLSTRKQVSNTRKELYKNDPEFRKRMKEVYNENMNKMIREDHFKVPGWGVSGNYKSIYFRSTNELKALIYFDKNGLLNQVETNIQIKSDKEMMFCDFRIGNKYYEIKDKTYPQDEREERQYKLLEQLKDDSHEVYIWNKKSDEIKSIAYIDILEHYISDDIVFIEKSKKYSLVKKLTKEKKKYARCKRNSYQHN